MTLKEIRKIRHLKLRNVGFMSGLRGYFAISISE